MISDMLDRTITFLQKRDGVDKALKIIRYSAKLCLASYMRGSESEISVSLRNLESSIGVSRKAFRLGKFLQNVKSILECSNGSRGRFLDVFSMCSEGLYYFVEQFVWLVKAGAISKKYGKKLNLLSAWAELLSYFGSIPVKYFEIMKLLEKEKQTLEVLQANGTQQLLSQDATCSHLHDLQTKRLLRVLSIFQDLCDGLLALCDVRGTNLDPLLIAFAGLISAVIGAHKNWVSVNKKGSEQIWKAEQTTLLTDRKDKSK